MYIYLSFKQILLNQISVLIHKKAEKVGDDDSIERIDRSLKYLQQALEQIKSYHHNSNFQKVVDFFQIELNEDEKQKIQKLTIKYGDQSDFKMSEADRPNQSPTGFTTTRSGTYFTGADEDAAYNIFPDDDSDDDDMDEKSNNARAHKQQNNNNNRMKQSNQNSNNFDRHLTPTASNTDKTSTEQPNEWVTLRGFSYWLKKQSFIKLKRKNDQKKYKQVWDTLIGLKLYNQWSNGKITSANIVGTNQPFIAIHHQSDTSSEMVKASIFRQSITQNRIFSFDIDPRESASNQHHARRSVDMDDDDDGGAYIDNEHVPQSANEILKGINLFNKVKNKDMMRIVATILWSSSLASNVLEELLHNPRFSMYGIHASALGNIIAKENGFNVTTTASVSYEDESKSYEAQGRNKRGDVEQFKLPEPQRPVSMAQQRQIDKTNFSVVGGSDNNDNNGNGNGNNGTDAMDIDANDGNNDEQVSDHERYYAAQQAQSSANNHQYHPATTTIPEESNVSQAFLDKTIPNVAQEVSKSVSYSQSPGPQHTTSSIPRHAKSGSVVQHDNPIHGIRHSEIDESHLIGNPNDVDDDDDSSQDIDYQSTKLG